MPVSAERELQEVRYVADVLVAYATKNGSAQQVAEAITVALREAGLASHGAVGPGCAGISGWIRVGCAGRAVALRVLAPRRAPVPQAHQRELAAVQVAVFGMGPRSDTEEAWQRSRSRLDRALAKRGWLTPVAVMVFGGVDPLARRTGPWRVAFIFGGEAHRARLGSRRCDVRPDS